MSFTSGCSVRLEYLVESDHLIEARHHANVEFYKCPDCKGKGGFYTQNGPDDYDVEVCDTCNGAGRVDRDQVEHMTTKSFYTRNEFKPIQEAKHIGPSMRKIRGILSVDEREADEYMDQRSVIITIKIFDNESSFENAEVIKIGTVDGRESWLAKRCDINKGDIVNYHQDKHGEFVSGWNSKTKPQSPWGLEPSNSY